MILVGQYDSPYVRRVAISLKLAGLQFTRDTRSVFAARITVRRMRCVAGVRVNRTRRGRNDAVKRTGVA